MHFWTAVSAIGGALARRVCIDEITFQYYPNFCVVLVAPPGVVSKSTTISHGMSLLRELPHVNFADDSTTYAEFIRALASVNEAISLNDSDDPLQSMWMNQCAMTIAISELGTFLKVEDEDAVNSLTDLIDCRNIFIKSTKHNGRDEIEFPFVNIVGATTPSWIQDKLKSQIGGWGLSSRIVFVYAERKKQYLWSPSNALANMDMFKRTRDQLVDDLKHISELNGQMSLTPSASALCEHWYDETQRKIEAYQQSPSYDNWTGYFLARKYGHMRKLSMVLSISQSDSLSIEESHVKTAIQRIEDVERDILAVFRPTAVTTALALNEQAVLERIVQETSAAGRLSKALAIRRALHFVDSTTAAKIIDNAISRGVFVPEQDKGSGTWLRIPNDC